MEPFSQIIESWYSENKRDLPWRQTTDPYKIWISEIILQQTRVAQGYDYYIRFIDYFPNVEKLAAADEDDVLRMWQGLGYYSRARNIHHAAKQIIDMGGFPAIYEEIRNLKGVGDYTAAAIASFAFGLPHAVVDGNVYRVLSRYFATDVPIDTSQGKRFYAELATSLLDKDNPAVYNQAVMDFGAIQCIPVQPNCGVCPLRWSCRALEQGNVSLYPIKTHKTKVSNRYLNYIYLLYNDRLILHRRKKGDIWQGLYEPVLIETQTSESDQHILASIEAYLFKKTVSLNVQRFVPLQKNKKHILSHQVLWTNFYLLKWDGITDANMNEDFFMIDAEERDHYAVSKLVKILYEEVDKLL